MRTLYILIAVTFSTCAWSETRRDEMLGVPCESLVEKEGVLGSTPLLPVNDMKSRKRYAFSGTHQGGKATIVYSCAANTDTVSSIAIYLPTPSEAAGMVRVDTEVKWVLSNGYRVCYDTSKIPNAPPIPFTPRVVNTRRNESVEYSISLSSVAVLEGEIQVNIQISRPTSGELFGGEVPNCPASAA